MTPGTYNPPSGRGESAVINRLAGTNIGNLVNFGGLAIAFDGVTNQIDSSCAGKNNALNNSGYVGKTFAAPTALDTVTVYGSNNSGFVSGSNPSVTIDIYGKNGAVPGSETDGTIIATLTFTETANESAGRAFNIADKLTMYDHSWARLAQAANANIYVAEVVFTGWQ